MNCVFPQCPICHTFIYFTPVHHTLPCCHLYHDICITKWYNSKNKLSHKCPMCQEEINLTQRYFQYRRKQLKNRYVLN